MHSNSKKISEEFDKPHRYIISSIQRKLRDMPALEKEYKESKYMSPQGKVLFCYECTEFGFDLIVMELMGKKALKWKLDKIKQVNAFMNYETNK